MFSSAIISLQLIAKKITSRVQMIKLSLQKLINLAKIRRNQILE